MSKNSCWIAKNRKESRGMPKNPVRSRWNWRARCDIWFDSNSFRCSTCGKQRNNNNNNNNKLLRRKKKKKKKKKKRRKIRRKWKKVQRLAKGRDGLSIGKQWNWIELKFMQFKLMGAILSPAAFHWLLRAVHLSTWIIQLIRSLLIQYFRDFSGFFGIFRDFSANFSANFVEFELNFWRFGCFRMKIFAFWKVAGRGNKWKSLFFCFLLLLASSWFHFQLEFVIHSLSLLCIFYR